MSRNRFVFILFLSSAFNSFTINANEILERKPHSVPLAVLTALHEGDGRLIEVFVTFEGSNEGWAIGPFQDRYVKDRRKERIDHEYREILTQAYLLSPFEVIVLDKVCDSFRKTLKIFERDLRFQRWDRCLFLDPFFCFFMKNFHKLYCASKNNMNSLPTVTKIADTLFDSSMTSPLSEARVNKWRSNKDHQLKLRIAAREFEFQIEQWQKKELSNKSRDPFKDYSHEFRNTYEIFVRLYFNLPPESKKTSK